MAMSAESLVSYTGERAADVLPVSGDGILTKFRQLLKETLSWYNTCVLVPLQNASEPARPLQTPDPSSSDNTDTDGATDDDDNDQK